MGLLSRLTQQAASRLGAREVQIPFRAGGENILVGFRSADDLAGIRRGTTEARWGWNNAENDTFKRRAGEMGRHDVKRVLDDAIDLMSREIAARPPQRYYFSGLTGGHARRYARDVAQRVRGTGYQVQRDGAEFWLNPTPLAYVNYASSIGSPALTAGAALGGAGLGLYGASRGAAE